ncbi:TolC family protein [Thermithiobacillus plumbiphilus]|uniref:TolC family protein n=1 Tax=Thermithiobacillus plumbiphilus TaxID=1729899 RepID=A0ABU9DCI0_9PROT
MAEQHACLAGQSRPAVRLLALVLGLLPGTSLALDFRESVELALRQNPDMQVSQAQLAQAEAGLHQAQARRYPSLSASLTGTYTNDALNAFGLKLSQRNATFNDFGAGEFNGPGSLSVAPGNLNHPGGTGNLDTRFELNIPIYNGGQIRGFIEQARAQLRAAQQGDVAARQQLIFNVAQAYQGVHAARSFVGVAAQGVQAAEAYVKTNESMLRQGMIVRSDLLSAQVRLEDARIQLEQARNAEAAAMDQLHLLIGMPLDVPLTLGPDAEIAAPAGSLADLQAGAVAGNPQIQAMRQQLAAAQAGMRTARAAYYPHLNAMARQDWNSGELSLGAPSYTVAGVLSWQLFDFGASRAGVAQAEAKRMELQARLRQAEDGIRLKVADAWRKVREAERRITLRRQALVQAEEAQRLVDRRYRNGVTTMVEVLGNQAQLDKARADLVQARYDQVIQRAVLRLATGSLVPESF